MHFLAFLWPSLFVSPMMVLAINLLLDFCDNFITNFVKLSGFFFEFLSRSTLGACNFLNFNPCFMIFSVSNALVRRVQVLFGHQKQQSPPLGSGLLEHFNACSSAVLPYLC
jgi:hypothetical protein